MMADGACYEIWCLVHSGDTTAQPRADRPARGLGAPSTDCITLHFFFNLPSPNFVWPGHQCVIAHQFLVLYFGCGIANIVIEKKH